MSSSYNHHADQPNLSNGRVDLPEDLDAMPAVDLAEALERALDTMTEENYDVTVIDAYLDALDRKAPMPEMPDATEAYVSFRQVFQDVQPTHTPPQDVPRHQRCPVTVRRFLRAASVAAITVLFILGGMVTAQAAGLDVFGAMARWTESVFSFGTVYSDGAGDIEGDFDQGNRQPIFTEKLEYTSLQDALDAYNITEVTAPKWLPENYVLDRLFITNGVDMDIFMLNASYVNNGKALNINIMRYTNVPTGQVEKTGTIVDTFEMDGVTCSLIENEDGCTVAWVTEHYECYIFGAPDIDGDVLQEIALSMFN